MKELRKQIDQILSETEVGLRNLIVGAAEKGDYVGVEEVRRIAVAVHNLRVQNEDVVFEAKQPPEVRRSSSEPTAHTRKKSARKGISSKYPTFELRKDAIVRIGWSKKQRREYNHKVPRSVYDLSVKAMEMLLSKKKGPFMAEQIIDELNQSRSDAIPSYQVYVVIGLLREKNLIKQIGRDGYEIPSDISSIAGNLLNNMRE